MIQVNIKPLSVNDAWQGRRFKTKKYKMYEKELFYLLPPQQIKSDRLRIILVFGFSNVNSDIDNPIKQTMDIMQKKYCFNDRNVYELIVKKEVVKKGQEYIKFKIEDTELCNLF